MQTWERKPRPARRRQDQHKAAAPPGPRRVAVIRKHDLGPRGRSGALRANLGIERWMVFGGLQGSAQQRAAFLGSVTRPRSSDAGDHRNCWGSMSEIP